MGILARIGFKLVSFEDTKNLYGRRRWAEVAFFKCGPNCGRGFWGDGNLVSRRSCESDTDIRMESVGCCWCLYY